MSDDDLDDFLPVFLDECRENIEALERGLLAIGDDACGKETLDDVFRAAHSIKGGAATFGLAAMAELTHGMESLLDDYRGGSREGQRVATADADLLLEALDALQALLGAPAAETDEQSIARHALQGRLAEASGIAMDGAEGSVIARDEQDVPRRWSIRFEPTETFLARGHDPLLLLDALVLHGEATVRVDAARVPPPDGFDPSRWYLAFDIDLETIATEATLREVFAWALDDCALEIEGRSIEPSGPADRPDGGAAAAPANEGEGEGEGAVSPPSAGTPAVAAPSTEQASIRIATDKIDQLIDLVGELVITQSMLSRVAREGGDVDHQELRARVDDLEQHTRELQERVMQVRMLPLASALGRLPRIVRDLSARLDKSVELVVQGGSTELDKTVLERLVDPLVHLVRNALDHGIESERRREDAGKPATATLTISARQANGCVLIDIADDGAGIDEDRVLTIARERGVIEADEHPAADEVHQLIFAPGFSTAAEITDTSGRGVGMDVVRRNILELGGRVRVRSERGIGTTIAITLPLTLSIMDGQLVGLDDAVYVVPMPSIVETLELARADVSRVPGVGDIFRYREQHLALHRLPGDTASDSVEPGTPDTPGRDAHRGLVVVIETANGRAGLLVDSVLGQQQVVIKRLDTHYRNLDGLGGATIMSDGSVALIVDPGAFAIDAATIVPAAA